MTKVRKPSQQPGQSLFVFLCVFPAVVLYTAFMVWPTLDVFRMSLFQWSGFGGQPTFIGLQNFVYLLSDNQFIRAFQNTILLMVVVSIATMAGGLVLGSILMRENLPGRNLYRFVLYIPSVLSIVVVAAIFSAIYGQVDGLLNGTLNLIGLGQFGQVWLGDRQIIIYSIGIAMVWQSLGYYLVIYMAGISSIPEALYEAAAIDGASRTRQFFAITLPLAWGTLRTTLIFFIIGSVNLSFVLVTAMTQGGPNGASEVLLSYLYRQAYTNSTYGYAMAIGVVTFVFSFVLALIVSRATKREVYQY
jgi:N-acetylglucosamine transport system permease protein